MAEYWRKAGQSNLGQNRMNKKNLEDTSATRCGGQWCDPQTDIQLCWILYIRVSDRFAAKKICFKSDHLSCNCAHCCGLN